MSEGDLIHKVLPVYPPLARSVRIQGQVVLQAVISKQGAIENLRLLTGHPMLVPAAIEAVRQWRYRSYVLNNEPVEVETQITVNFSLAGN
jgi:protein TonB